MVAIDETDLVLTPTLDLAGARIMVRRNMKSEPPIFTPVASFGPERNFPERNFNATFDDLDIYLGHWPHSISKPRFEPGELR
jgi:hypothetical protein